jgi:4-hydroxybenzoate polyprenyltransferase
MHIGSFWELFLLFGSIAFAVTQIEKSIARRTADEIERRSKPPAAPKPKTPRVSGRVKAWAAGLTFLGLLMLYAYAVQPEAWGVVAAVLALALVSGIMGEAEKQRRRTTAQVSTDRTARHSSGPPIPRPE